MSVYFANYAITLFLGAVLIYPYQEVPRRNKKIFVTIATVNWILISGLRSDLVGRDTINYMNMFDQVQMMPWELLFLNLKSAFSSFPIIKEALFPILNKIIGIFSTNHIVYKFAIAAIFMIPFGNYVLDYSDDPCMSFALYDVLLYNMFSITGYRQVVAVAITVLLGSKYLFQRRPIPFFLTVIIGSLFHKSTLFYGVLYIISEKKITKKYLISIFIAIVGIALLNNRIFSFLKVFAGYDEYVGNEGLMQFTFLALFASFMIVALYSRKTIIREYPNTIPWYNSLLISTLIAPLLQQDPSVMRLIYLFIFPMLLLLPKVMKVFSTGSNKLIMYVAIYLVFALNLLGTGRAYTFFWQY